MHKTERLSTLFLHLQLRSGVLLKGQRSISRIFSLTIIVVLAAAIAIFCIFSYTAAVENSETSFYESQLAAETQITASSNLIDRGNRIYEATFNSQLEKGLNQFRDVYVTSGGDPASIDLPFLKEDLQQYTEAEIDLYVINEDGIIEYSTYEPDIGIDFSEYQDLYLRLTIIRQGDAFVPDRSGSGIDHTEVLRKFAYLPTPDHRYLLEMSMNMESLPDEQRIFTYDEVIFNVREAHPAVKDIQFYSSTFVPISGENGSDNPRLDDATIDLLGDVWESGKPIAVADPENQTETRYLIVDIEDTTSPISSLIDFYAKVTYSTEARDAAVFQAFILYGLIMLLGLSIAGLLGFVVSRHVSRPVTEIVDDIDIIASGNLDHEIRPARIPELSRIADSTAILVTDLKEKIDEINRKNRELAASEAEKTLILDAVTEAVFFLDADYRIIWANAAGRRIIPENNKPSDKFPCFEIVHEEALICEGCPIPEAMVKRHPVQGTVVTTDGRISEVTASPVLNDGGVPVGVVVTALDVTGREAAAEALRVSERQYRDLFSSMKTGFALISSEEDGNIRFLTLNPAFAEITEIQADEAVNADIETVFPGRKALAQEILQRLQANHTYEPMALHSDILHKDLRLTAFATANENEAGILLEDVTGLVELRRQQRETLEQIEKNLEHLAILNDEIRNPLMVILGYTELDEGVYADRIYEQIGIINELIRRLDQRWLESEKVREFLRKHHDWDPDES